jgi:hypothetical protein
MGVSGGFDHYRITESRVPRPNCLSSPFVEHPYILFRKTKTEAFAIDDINDSLFLSHNAELGL